MARSMGRTDGLAVMSAADVPSPIDLRLMPDALERERTAMQKRPWRMEFSNLPSINPFDKSLKGGLVLHHAN